MIAWLLAVTAGAIAAGVQYGRTARSPRILPLALLRALSAALIVALLFGAPAGRASSLGADVALDASESWLRGSDSSAWKLALDSARALGGTTQRFGDSLRTEDATVGPRDRSSALRDVTDAATASGRAVVIVTDGELDEPELLATLPRGSRAVVIPRREASDVALAALDVPRALLAGDTVVARVTMVAGAAGASAGRVMLRLDDAILDSAVVPALAPFAERVVSLRGVAAGAERAALVRAIVATSNDREPRNDTLAVGVDVTRAPAAVFVSTAPDFDAREAVAALRGVTSLPTRAFYRVAPGMWRADGTLARVDESVVREALREAPMAIVHGDTMVFGAPRTATRGALLLFAPPQADDGEYFAMATPASPLAPQLAGIPFDSLPPLSVSSALPRGEWQGLIARRAATTDDRRAALVGWEVPRRVAILGASGFWRWRFRGGVRADSYSAFFGALYDWLAAGRTDRRELVPEGEPLRAGMPLRWRRGAPGDTLVTATLMRRDGTAQRRTVTVRFAEGANVAETPGLPPGIYDVTSAGGVSLLAVNASRELVPRRVTIASGAVGGEVAAGEAPGLRERGWIFVLVVLLLCAEWLLRRRVGLR